MLRVEVATQNDEVHVRTNLGQVQPELYPAVFAALAEHVGLSPEAMHKAADDDGHAEHEEPDPRYPEVQKLIEAARKDWQTWGDQLVAAVTKLLNAGKLLPLTKQNERTLSDLFRDHAMKLVLRFAGHHPDDPATAKSGSYIDTAWRLGRGLKMLEAHQVNRAGSPSLESIVRTALKPALTAQDEEALRYVKRRGAIFMRRPADQATSEIARELNEEEFRAIRGAIAHGIEEKYDNKRIAREINEALKGNASLQNNMESVVRQELAFAHSHGAYVALKTQAAGAGHDDPEVYKFVSPGACRDCKRIWGLPSNPKRYRLSVIEAREAAGGNFKKPRREWGPVIGPVHVNCTEGPLQLYTKELVDAINDVAKDYDDWFRQKR